MTITCRPSRCFFLFLFISFFFRFQKLYIHHHLWEKLFFVHLHSYTRRTFYVYTHIKNSFSLYQHGLYTNSILVQRFLFRFSTSTRGLHKNFFIYTRCSHTRISFHTLFTHTQNLFIHFFTYCHTLISSRDHCLVACNFRLTTSRYLAPIFRQFVKFSDMPEIKRKHPFTIREVP